MSDAPDELESAMILGDPGETVSLDTIKAMAQAVRDAGYGSIEAERARIVAAINRLPWYASPELISRGYAIAAVIVKGEA